MFLEKAKTGNPHYFIFCLFYINFFISLRTEKFTNALYIKYLYVFVKEAYNTSGFL